MNRVKLTEDTCAGDRVVVELPDGSTSEGTALDFGANNFQVLLPDDDGRTRWEHKSKVKKAKPPMDDLL